MARKREPTRQASGRQESSEVANPKGLSRGWRIVLSLMVSIQLLAVIAEPFQFFTRSPRGVSPAAEYTRSILAPYVEFAYLNHGYFFFAPEPGPSHSLDCGLSLEDGRRVTLRFPDRQAQWPRLLYHRHFMMAENLHQLWVPPVSDAVIAVDDPIRPILKADRQRFEDVRDSMKRHLVHRYGAVAATIDRVEHRLPSSDEVFRDRLRLDDPRLYVTLPDIPPEPGSESGISVELPTYVPPPLRQPSEPGRSVAPGNSPAELIEVQP